MRVQGAGPRPTLQGPAEAAVPCRDGQTSKRKGGCRDPHMPPLPQRIRRRRMYSNYIEICFIALIILLVTFS